MMDNDDRDDDDPFRAEAFAARIARTTVVGDLRDVLLDALRATDAWGRMDQLAQEDVAARLTETAVDAVRRIVAIVAADGRRTLAGHLAGFATKKGEVKATVIFPGGVESVVALDAALGGDILMLVADAVPYLGERAPAAIEPDQPDLGWGGETPAPKRNKRRPTGTKQEARRGGAPTGKEKTPTPYDRGLAAGKAGSAERNPYPVGSGDRETWDSAYRTGAGLGGPDAAPGEAAPAEAGA